MEILQELGMFAIAIAAITWLSKSIATQVLSRDIEKYKSRLKLEAVEHQVRFSRIHSKQADVIEDYYNLLNKAEACIDAFRKSKKEGRLERDQRLLEKATELCLEASVHHRKHDLYFPTEISEMAKELELEIVKYSTLSSGVLDLLTSGKLPEVTQERRALVENVVRDGIHKFEDRITPLLTRIKKDFQERIGIEPGG